jgi:TolB-like protein/Flp pilus assembly protein TadD
MDVDIQSGQSWTDDEQAQIRAWLQRIRSHPLFAHSARQQSLLAFIIDETLSQRGHLLKGYTLGVEVFGRNSDFDPTTDSIVRVEITRLRSKLVEYYAGDGRGDEVLFELPKGGYAPLIHLGKREAAPAVQTRPSLAVLPFANGGDDPAQGYFADGLTDDLITDISKLSGLFVISRQSAFIYKGSPKRTEEIATELGVRYLLVGCVRKAADRVRISAQLVDAQSGGDLWAERYDRDAADIFAVQDDVAKCIVKALQVQLTGFERERLGHEGTGSVEAHDALLRGLSEYWHYSLEGCAAAQACFRQSLQRDPHYAVAHAWLARSYVLQYSMGWNTHKDETLAPALMHAQRAVEIDDFLPLAHAMLGWVQIWYRNPEIAIEEGRRACALNPNDADAHLFLSFTLSADGKGEEALRHIEQGMRLNPHPSAVYLMALGQAYIALEDFDAAIAAFKRGIEINPGFVGNHAYLAVYYALLDRMDEAEAAAAATRRIFPGALPHFMSTNPVMSERFVKGYQLVGFDKDTRVEPPLKQ